MSTLGERIKIVQLKSGLQQPRFAKSLGISKESLIHYQKNRRHPDSVFLSNLCELYEVNPTWLLLGRGEPFAQEVEPIIPKMAIVPNSDPVEHLLAEEEERAGVSLSPKQRTAILKIFRELVSRDVRSIRELLQAISREQGRGQE